MRKRSGGLSVSRSGGQKEQHNRRPLPSHAAVENSQARWIISAPRRIWRRLKEAKGRDGGMEGGKEWRGSAGLGSPDNRSR